MQSKATNIYKLYWRKYSPRFAYIESIIKLYSILGSSNMCSKLTCDKITVSSTCYNHIRDTLSVYIYILQYNGLS